MKQLRGVLAVLSVALICACSDIKENRSVCPCWYTVDLTGVRQDVRNLHFWFFDDKDRLLYRDSLSGGVYEKYNVELTRGRVRCCIWGNLSEGTLLDDDGTPNSTLLKVGDLSSDSLFHYFKELDATSEFCNDTVRLKKEYAVVDFIVKGDIISDDHLQLRINSTTGGRYIDGRFIEENVSTVSLPVEEKESFSKFCFRLMRQRSLRRVGAQIYAWQDGVVKLVKELPLGVWLEESGYNMSADNLADISVELDFVTSTVTVKMGAWQVTKPVDFEI